MKEKLTKEFLQDLITYDDTTGIVKWKVRPRHHFKTRGGWLRFNQLFANRSVRGTTQPNTYLFILINGTSYLLHRIIWALTHNEWPKEIDHINGNAQDNRLVNLRAINHADNMKNQGLTARKQNKSGLKGAYAHGNKWQAAICINYSTINLGTFNTKEEAHAAYCEAASKYHLNGER